MEVVDTATLPDWVMNLPAVNATLNGIATVLLVAAFVAIKNKNIERHRTLMISAFVVSIVFLASYLTYHTVRMEYQGVSATEFQGEGVWSFIYYYIVLTPHIILAAFVPFLAIYTLWMGLKDNRKRHRKIARITLPVWLYTSVTGVLVYLMLYQWFA